MAKKKAAEQLLIDSKPEDLLLDIVDGRVREGLRDNGFDDSMDDPSRSASAKASQLVASLTSPPTFSRQKTKKSPSGGLGHKQKSKRHKNKSPRNASHKDQNSNPGKSKGQCKGAHSPIVHPWSPKPWSPSGQGKGKKSWNPKAGLWGWAKQRTAQQKPWNRKFHGWNGDGPGWSPGGNGNGSFNNQQRGRGSPSPWK